MGINPARDILYAQRSLLVTGSPWINRYSIVFEFLFANGAIEVHW